MKARYLSVCFVLLAWGTARAQEVIITPADTVLTLEPDRPPPAPKKPLLTAADSARERARIANARRLRQLASGPAPAPQSTGPGGYGPLGLSAPKPPFVPEAPKAAKVTPKKRPAPRKR